MVLLLGVCSGILLSSVTLVFALVLWFYMRQWLRCGAGVVALSGR